MSDNKFLPITLGIANFSSGAQSLSGKAAPLDAEIIQKVFSRDKDSCRFCGFHSKKYQQVVFINGNTADARFDNLATGCMFCHQCFDLEKVASMRSGALIWMPEISQAEVHHVARAIYVARISQGSMAEMAKSTLDQMMKRREEVKIRLETDDPFVLAMVMRDFLGPKHYDMRSSKLDGVRLFPLDRRIIKEGDLEFNQFPQILAYWRSKDGPFGGKIPNKWKLLYAEIANAA